MSDITVHIIDREGMQHEIAAPTDMNMNLMEVCKAYELPVKGTCGGVDEIAALGNGKRYDPDRRNGAGRAAFPCG